MKDGKVSAAADPPSTPLNTAASQQKMRTLKSIQIDCHFVCQKGNFQPPVTLKLQNFFAFCFLTRLNPREVSSL